MTTSTTLGQRVSARRTSLGLSVRQAAALVGCSQSTMSRIESGEQVPTPTLLEALARTLGFDLRELYDLAGHPLPDELPDLGPYVRMKFKNLPPRAYGEITSFVEFLHAKYGVEKEPPTDGSDEVPEGERPKAV
ncbi:MAG: helix-turn-helix transcriptional regulator [Actinomycetota bacterium]